jgi:hypothetical protein
MKKLLILFSICSLVVSAALGQDNTYYTGDESTVTVKSQEAPPALPTYVQPPCPGDGYLWNPGYWAWGTGGYYWVAGVWVMPPGAGMLWTPGYWGFYGGYYGWHGGYWGESVGYYGGVNYGFGYGGSGFYGGRWEGGHFRYNTAVWHVNGSIHNTYSEAHHFNGGGHSSFNGPGGVKTRPAGGEEATVHATNHTAATKEQQGHEKMMGSEKGQLAHTNQGRPATHSMSAPGGQRFNQGGHSMGGGHSGGGGGHAGGGGRR